MAELEVITTQHEGQSWPLALEKLCDYIIVTVPDVKYADMWNDQPYHEREEYPFPVPAVYIDFELVDIADKGDKGQLITFDIIVIAHHEDIADTHTASTNRVAAFEWAALLVKLHRALHGHHSEHYSKLTRVGIRRMDSARPGQRLYGQVYRTVISDDTAIVEHKANIDETEWSVEHGITPAAPAPKLYDLGF